MQISKHTLFVGLGLCLGAASAVACSASGASAPASSGSGASGPGSTSGAGSPGGAGGSGEGGSTAAGDIGDDLGSGVTTGGGGGGGGDVLVPAADPKTCAEAAASKSYIGCDFWPTVTANIVWSIFDYAVVVANAGDEVAEVEVTRAGETVAQAEIPPNSLSKVYLPWVPELKGPDANACGSGRSISRSVRVDGGAYHLVSTRPVTVYQFNALEYKGAGGPDGKDWSSCPGNDVCDPRAAEPTVGCFSFTNDASLLLPSTAMTGNYRVPGQQGWSEVGMGGTLVITGTTDGTSVTVSVAQGGAVVAGGGVPATRGGESFTVELDEGDVVEILGDPASDLSGSLVTATKPVQVLTGMPCVQAPIGRPACDHIEESVFPAETLGKHYFVTAPSSPRGQVIGHIVRLYGNVDGTTLTYPSGRPDGGPTRIDAGQVVDLSMVRRDFEVVGDHEFAVSTFMLGADIVDPSTPKPRQKGDPSQSHPTAVEQYRTKYVFLAPSDYDESYVDIVQPMDASITLDGAAVGVAPTPIGNGSGFGVARVKLGPGNGGAHVLIASAPVGIQVIGYGSYTSYQYPGGLNLLTIAPPPPPPR
ncbi:IgGFc-binding protein [Sorangium sp. So ce1097]|uniref:IgGFc-binding protein n=1 Tax=Sorangium sp. So ce1097 TaxID=3133330 RepID=UPI003F5F2AD7